jgi:hypothetical protein
VIENLPFVGRQAFVARGPQPDEEGSGPVLVDVDDVACGEVDQRRRHGVVRDAEAMREEVHHRRRLAAELQRPWADDRLRRCAGDEDGRRRREPRDGRGDGDEREDEIRFAGQARIVSAEADGPS